EAPAATASSAAAVRVEAPPAARAAATSAWPERGAISAELAARFDATAAEFLRRGNVAGAVVAVAHRGQIVLERSYGLRDAAARGGRRGRVQRSRLHPARGDRRARGGPASRRVRARGDLRAARHERRRFSSGRRRARGADLA